MPEPVRAFPWRVALSALAVLSPIVVSLAGAGEAAPRIPVQLIIAGSLSEAQRILARLKNGDDFAALARQFSIDPTANAGGYLGKVAPDSLLPELRNALDGLEPGQVSAIVRIPAGYAIVRRAREDQNDAAEPQRMLAVSGPLSSPLTHDTSGYQELLAAIRQFTPADPNWGMDLEQVCEVRREAPARGIQAIRAYLTAKGAAMDPNDREAFVSTLAGLFSSTGDIDNALVQWEDAYRLAASSGRPDTVKPLEETLAVGYLHRFLQSDRQIATQRQIIPRSMEAVGGEPGDIENAVTHLLRALRDDPANLELRWLLNLSYMVGGGYPGRVPKEFLIPPSAFASGEDLGRFPDVAPAAGLNVYGTAGGAIVDDFENNGLLDVVTSQIDDCAPLHFFHNNGDGTFTDRAKQAGLSGETGGLNIIQADYNNDGCIDILVLRGGWEFPRRRSLLRNNCDGTFTDVTAQSGLMAPARSSQSAAWADINNDGRLDLFIANENSPSQLFLNNGDGTFTDISHKAGIDRVALSKGVVAGDYDNDGYPDFFVSNFNGENFLYHNNGDLMFTEVAAAAGVQEPRMSFAAWFFDYDNDGWPDLFVTDYYLSVDESVRSWLKMPRRAETVKLYRNNGDSTFRDVTAEVGLDHVYMPMGSNFGDIDNDGFLDIYLGMGNPSFASLLPNTLLRNQGGKRFVDITASSGAGAISKGHGVAFADLGNTGDEDIFIVMGGPTVGDSNTSRLFRNPGAHGNDWITLRLAGVKSNRSAIGTRITLTVNNAGVGRRRIVRTVGSGGSFGASPLEQHIGLGRSATIENIEVWWPASKTRQNFAQVRPNQFLEIREFDAAPHPLSRRSFQVGGAAR